MGTDTMRIHGARNDKNATLIETRQMIGKKLQDIYGFILTEPLPDGITRLLDQLAKLEPEQ